MHYNIALLHKKVANCVSYFLWKVMHYVTFALPFVTWAGIAYLFINNKKKNSKVIVTVKALSRQKWN